MLSLSSVYSLSLHDALPICFCGGGILERHPNLRAAFLEGNCSWLPFLMWRMDEHWERTGDVHAPELKMAPSKYWKRQCFASAERSEEHTSELQSPYELLCCRCPLSTLFPYTTLFRSVSVAVAFWSAILTCARPSWRGTVRGCPS